MNLIAHPPGPPVGLRRAARAVFTGLAVFWLCAVAYGQASAGVSADERPVITIPFELSRPVEQSLVQLQEDWLQLTGALFQGDEQRADDVVENLIATSSQLGLTRLPDLSLGAGARALEASRAEDFGRAYWALEAAESLDPGRPESAFVRSKLCAREGRWIAAAGSYLGGFRRLSGAPATRRMALSGLTLWIFFVWLLTGAVFLLVQVVVKGGLLLRDAANLFAGAVPGAVAAALALVVLFWPILLPMGIFWLLVYWSVILWGYGSLSERLAITSIWLALALVPAVVEAQGPKIELALSAPVRAVDDLRQERLSGSLFQGLDELAALEEEDPAVLQLLADVHRSLGQWDHARRLYQRVLEKEPENPRALMDIGSYYFHKGDFGSATRYFEKAVESDPDNVSAYYSLSQAYSERYLFEDAQRALAQAQRIDDLEVTRYIGEGIQQPGAGLSGGQVRAAEIEGLVESHGERASAPDLWRSLRENVRSSLFAAGLLVAAVLLHILRRNSGYSSLPRASRSMFGAASRLRAALAPGLVSSEGSKGVKAFLALLIPVALGALPSSSVFYRLPLGIDAGPVPLYFIAALGLILYFAVRLTAEFRWGR